MYEYIQLKADFVCFLPGNSPASEFRRREITQKKAYNIQYTAKVRNQEKTGFISRQNKLQTKNCGAFAHFPLFICKTVRGLVIMFWKLNVYLISFRHQFHSGNLLTCVLVQSYNSYGLSS
jgi:hypothetical protein